MKLLAVTVLALAVVASAKNIDLEDGINNIAYNYLTKIGVSLAEKVRKAEEEATQNPSRIFGGSLANLGQFPYQAGLLSLLPSGGTSLAGGVLISTTRVLSAAHNFNNGVTTVSSVTVVLGSTTIFTGGTRLTTSAIVLHENWNPATIANDIAMLNLPYAVVTSGILAPIALPSGSQLNENFVGDIAVASGFGMTESGVLSNQPLSFVNLPVMPNAECSAVYGSYVQSSNVCVSGAGGKNICTGDSGGPLAVTRNGRPLLIGISSFGSPRGCAAGEPSAFARVSSFMSWINNRL